MRILLCLTMLAIYFATQDGYSTPPMPATRDNTERLLRSEQAPRIQRSPLQLLNRSTDDIVQVYNNYFGYVLKCQVGQGCSASVWRAENGYEKTIAIKKFRPELANSCMVQDEIRTLREVTEEQVSTYLVQAFETVAGVGRFLDDEIGMEFLEGKNLEEIFSWIEEEVVWECKLWVMGHVLFAVSDMVNREEPFVHNDLHWGNVMVVLKDGVLEVKIVDLGQAGFVPCEILEMCEYNSDISMWELVEVFDEDRLCRSEPGHWIRQLDLIPSDVDTLAFTLFQFSPNPDILKKAKNKAESGLSSDEDSFLRKRLKETSAYERKKNIWKIGN